jgi:hypothetical protein
VIASGALLHEHALNKIGDTKRPGGGHRVLGAASLRGMGASGIRGGGGKMLGEKRSEKLGQQKRVDHALLFVYKYLLQRILAETRGNLITQNDFQATGLGHLPSGATETDLPAESGDAFITGLGFFR